jgi:antibiotic biosynthesis monooxygenase (ABM) superfamily enzyme
VTDDRTKNVATDEIDLGTFDGPISLTDTDETGWQDSAITTSLTIRPVAGREREFEAFLEGITGAARRAPGYVTGRIFRPRGNNRDYRIVTRFDSAANLHAWKGSEERRAWYTIGEELTEHR